GIIDEAENGPRIVRRTFRKQRTTVNVVARLGDRDARRILLVLSHHDAAQTGKIFDQSLYRQINERFPGVLQRFKRQPPQVWLVSAGAEETLQDGTRAFMARHGSELDPASTWVLVPDTVGSPRLMMTEGEGPFWMHEYTDPSFRDLVEQTAGEQGIGIERG